MGAMFSLVPHVNIEEKYLIKWEHRYGGAMSVALVDGEAVAGISGPWPDGCFALVWWSTSRFAILPVLEFYSSTEAAKDRVETIVGRLDHSGSVNCCPENLSVGVQREPSNPSVEAASSGGALFAILPNLSDESSGRSEVSGGRFFPDKVEGRAIKLNPGNQG